MNLQQHAEAGDFFYSYFLPLSIFVTVWIHCNWQIINSRCISSRRRKLSTVTSQDTFHAFFNKWNNFGWDCGKLNLTVLFIYIFSHACSTYLHFFGSISLPTVAVGRAGIVPQVYLELDAPQTASGLKQRPAARRHSHTGTAGRPHGSFGTQGSKVHASNP